MKGEIELNGEKYILKEEVKDLVDVQVENFEYGLYKKYLEKLYKLFSFARTPISQQQALSQENLAVFDHAKVCMCVAKSNRAKDILRLFICNDEEYVPLKVLELDYEGEGAKKGQVNLSTEYMKKIYDFLTVDTEYEKIHINTAKDYPATFSNSDWIFILAPRVS